MMKKHMRVWCLILALLMALSVCGCQSEESQGSSAAVTTEAQTTGVDTTTAEVESRDEHVDFVVVGAGAAGVSAATQAAYQGKSVILLEKLAFAGGSSALNEGYFWACE